MAFTFQQKFDQAKLDRSIAVSSKNAVVKARADVLEEDTFNNNFLHGDTKGNIGINDLIWYWLKEKSFEGGDIYFRPVLGDSISQWRQSYEDIMVSALSNSGDSLPEKKWWWPFPISDERYLNGFYPPDDNGVPGKELNWATDYLNRNGDSRPGDSTWGYFTKGDSSGFLFHLYGLKATVGWQPLSYGDSIVSDYIYTSPITAIEAAKILMYGTALIATGTQYGDTAVGKGLIGRRRADVDITTQASGNYRYVIGDGDSDQPLFYGDSIGDTNLFLATIPFKTNLLTKLNDVCVFGDSDSAYIAHLNALSAELALIEADTNTLFTDPDMAAELGDTASVVDTLIGNLSRYIGNSGDVWVSLGVGDSSLYGLHSYLSSADGTEADFDDALNLTKFLNDALITAVETRYTALDDNTIMGDTGAAESDFTLARKWRAFWVKTRIAKPESTLLSYNALYYSILDAERAVDNKNEQLQAILGDTLWDHYQYIPTPEILASFYDPKLDQDDGSLIVKKITAVFDGQQHASKYVVLRKLYDEASSTTVSNNAWGDTYYYDEIVTLDPDTRFVITTYTDFGKVNYAGDSIQDYQELFLYQHQLFSSNDLYGDTSSNIILEPKFFEYGDTAAYPLGSGDTRYSNPRNKTWSGLGDSSGVTGFYGAGINLVKDPEDLTTANWTAIGTPTVELTNEYIDGKRFNKITCHDTDAAVINQAYTWTAAVHSIQCTFKKGNATTSADDSRLLLTDGTTSCFFIVDWSTSTVSGTNLTIVDAEWIGDDIVHVSGFTNSATLAALGWIGVYPNVAEAVGDYVYVTAIQVEALDHPTPYMGDSRGASSLGYTYTWGDSGAIECYVRPRFNWDEAKEKWIFGDYDGSEFNMGLLYDITNDSFRFAINNEDSTPIISLYAGINGAGYEGDTAFVSNTYLHQWHHLKCYWKFYGDSITYGDTKIFKLFYNGVFVSGDSTGDSISFQSVLGIGGVPFYTSPTGYEFNGEITDFLIWDYGDTSTTHYDNQVPYFYPDPFPTGTNYLYRVQTIDSRDKVGGDITKSLQSNMFDSTEGRTFTAISGDSVLELGDSHDYKKKEYVVVNGTSNSNGYYKLTRTEDTNIYITPTLGADTSGTVYPCTSVVFIEE